LVAWPLTKSMCAPISDGAGAVILASERVMRRFDETRSVPIRGVGLSTGVNRTAANHDSGAVSIAANKAFMQAAIRRQDIDVAEVHDATSFGEIHQLENIGLFARGEAGPASIRGETRIG